MDKGMPHVKADLECPVLKQKKEVELGVNVFRGAEQGGLDVTACSEFLHGAGAPTCGKDCMHTHEAQELHKQQVEMHQHEIEKIGRNVIG